MSTTTKRAGALKASAAKVPASKKAAGKTTGRAAAEGLVKAGTAKSKQAPKSSTAAKAARASHPGAATPAKKTSTPRAKKPAMQAQPKLKLVPTKPAPALSTVPKGSVRTPVEMTAPKPQQDKVRIFQIYYRPEQRQYLDPAFEPYNNEGDNSPLLEFNVFRKLMNSDLVKGADLWGALSWKFTKKTSLTGEQLRQIIAGNPGYDVYYCNPFPEIEGLYQNLWLQGETCHPNFLILCRDFFHAAGLDEDILNQIVSSQYFAASNYFVATPAFWQDYMQYADSLILRAERKMSPTAKAIVNSSAADNKGAHAGASYMPFIIERLFGLFIKNRAEKYRAYKFASIEIESNTNVHLKLLKQMKDVAANGKSVWLATCWINYRNLYLLQSCGRDWFQRYGRSLTPLAISF